VALAAASASAERFVRAGAESTSVRGQVRVLSPLAAGLQVRMKGGAVTEDRARRSHAIAVGRQLGFAATPVLTSTFPASVAGVAGYVPVVVMARSGASAHVRRLSRGPLDGVGCRVRSQARFTFTRAAS
jgi:hypothetical protein